jgi:hypothetical protein
MSAAAIAATESSKQSNFAKMNQACGTVCSMLMPSLNCQPVSIPVEMLLTAGGSCSSRTAHGNTHQAPNNTCLAP